MNNKFELKNRPEFTEIWDYPCKWKNLPNLQTRRHIQQAILWLLEDINSDRVKPDKGLAMLFGFNALLNTIGRKG